MKGLLPPIINSLPLISLMRDPGKTQGIRREETSTEVCTFTRLWLSKHLKALWDLSFYSIYANSEIQSWNNISRNNTLHLAHSRCSPNMYYENCLSAIWATTTRNTKKQSVKWLKTAGQLIMLIIFINTHTHAHVHTFFKIVSRLFKFY